MTPRYASVKISTFINVTIAIMFVAAAVTTIAVVNRNMRQQAHTEAEAKMRLMLDHSMAIHTYFSKTLKPNLFQWTEPFRDADYFDPSWMSSTYAVREMEKLFATSTRDDYYYKDAAINARSPENEADADERAFIMELKSNPALEPQSAVRTIDDKPYLVVLSPGEVLQADCLRCHSHPDNAPQDLVNWYGPERSFHRESELGSVISAVSVRVPLAVAYAEANRLSLQLALFVMVALGLVFAAQFWLSKRFYFDPLIRIRDATLMISGNSAHLGDEIPLPVGRELHELTAAFNVMSVGLRHSLDHLEERVNTRTLSLKTANERLEREIRERQQAEDALRAALQQANEARAALLSVFEDQKQTEASLAAERSLLRTLVDHLPVAVYIKDTAGRKTLSNPADVRYIGAMSEAEVLGKNDFDLYPPELAAAFYADDMHVIESGQRVLNREEAMTLPGGARGRQLTSKVPMHDSAGRVIGLVGIGQDITQLKQAEDKIRQLNEELEARIVQRTAELTLTSERLTLATEAAGIGIWDWDVRNDVLVWDKTTCMLFGLGKDEFSGDLEGFLQIVHPEDVDRVVQHVHAVLEGEEKYEDEFRVVLSGGAIRYLRGEGSFTRDAHNEVVRVVGVNIDITERKRAQQELHLFNEMMVGREQRVIELKEEVNLLSAELGRDTPYPPIWGTAAGP